MNPLTPREELEIRITALLMGELSPEEAAALQSQIDADPELSALQARLRRAVELLREARNLPEQPAAHLQLSPERREQMLAKFRGLKVLPAPIPTPGTLLPSIAQQKKKRDWKWVGPVGIAAAITIFGGGFLLTTVMRPYSASRQPPDFAAETANDVGMEAMPPSDSRAFAFSAPAEDNSVTGTARLSSRYVAKINEAESKQKMSGESISRLTRLSDEAPAAAPAPQRTTIASSLYLPKGENEAVVNLARKLEEASVSQFGTMPLVDSIATGSVSSESQRLPGHPATTSLSPAMREVITDKEASYRLIPRIYGGIGSPMEASPRSEGENWVDGNAANGKIDPLSTDAPAPAKAETNWAFKQLGNQPVDAGLVAGLDKSQPTPSKPASAGVNADVLTPASAASAWASQPGAIRTFASQADGTIYRLTAESKDANSLSQLSPSLPAPAAAKADAPEPMAAADFAIAPQQTLSLATVAAKKAPVPVALAAAPVDAKPTSGPSALFDVDGEKPVNAEYFSKSLAGVPLPKEKAAKLADVAAANAPVAPIVIDPSADDLKTNISGLATGRGLERQKLAVAGDGLAERERRQELGRYDLQEKVVEKPAGEGRDNKAADFDDVKAKAMSEVSSEWQRPYRRFEKKQIEITDKSKAATPAAASSVADSQSNGMGVQQQFVESFLTARKGEDDEKNGRTKEAVENYREAASKLARVKNEFPNWQSDIVDFRLKRTMDSLNRLEGKKAELGDEPSPFPPLDPQSPALLEMPTLGTGSGIANLADNTVALQKEMKAHDFDDDALALGGAVKTGNGTLQIGKRADVGSERTEGRTKSDSQPTSADRATAGLGFIADEQAAQVQIDGRTDSFFRKSAPDANYWDQKVTKGKDDAKQWFEQAPNSHFTDNGMRGSSPATNPADKNLWALYSRGAGGYEELSESTREDGGAQGVDLDLAPQVVEFEGFINYGSPIPTTSIDANGREVKNVITSSFVGKPGLATGKFGEAARGGSAGAGAALREEDAFAALGDLAFSLPVVGNPAAAKLADDLFTMPVVGDPYEISAPLSTSGKVVVDRPLVPFNYGASSKVELAKKIEPPAEPPAPPQKAEAPVPQPEISVKENAFSTFSLNVSDVSFKLAESALGQNAMPNVESVRVEEFINALDYRDPAPAPGAPLAFASERARYPFAQNRDLLRLSVKTAAEGRQAGRPLNITLLLDNSGSMERADRVRILQESLAVLAKQLQPQDKLSIITFSRIPRLWADGVAGDKASEFTGRVAEIRPEGGTDLGAAMDLGYTTALKHYQVGSVNRVVLLTDGAANLGNVDAAALKAKVESHRKQGVAFDCFGVGWEGYNDDLLEQLSRNGDGRYGFINTPEAAATEFAGALAGALRVAASDVKVQVEFNPRRVTSYRQIGYAKHQLKKEQFRDNTVDAAEIGAAEAGNALYTVEIDPSGVGDIGVVRVRFKVPGTTDYKEHEWAVPFNALAPALDQSSSSLRLAATAGAFGEFLAQTQFATDVTTDKLLGLINGIPAIYGADPRPGKLEWMIRQAKSISGR